MSVKKSFQKGNLEMSDKQQPQSNELLPQPLTPPQGELIVETPQGVASVPAPAQTTVVVSNQQSALGYWGLLLSLCGVVTCGFTSIPGFFVSLAGMFSPGPKACAIWGTVLGLVGGIPFGIFVLPFVLLGLLGMLGLAGGAAMTAGAAAAGAGSIEHVRSIEEEQPENKSEEPEEVKLADADEPLPSSTMEESTSKQIAEPPAPEIDVAKQLAIEEHNQKIANLQKTLNDLTSIEPKLPVVGLRKWKASTGQTVVAKLIRINETHVKLEKEDGSQVNVERKQLSTEEQKRLDDKYNTYVDSWKDWQTAINQVQGKLDELESQAP